MKREKCGLLLMALVLIPTVSPTCGFADCDAASCVIGPPKNCTKCRPGFGFPSATIQTVCRKCSTNYGCAYCTTLTQCTKCNSTSLAPLNDGSGKCAECNTNYGCARCNTLQQCLQCNSTSLAPLKDGSGRCAECGLNCLRCLTNGPGKCDTCRDGFQLQENKTCIINSGWGIPNTSKFDKCYFTYLKKVVNISGFR